MRRGNLIRCHFRGNFLHNTFTSAVGHKTNRRHDCIMHITACYFLPYMHSNLSFHHPSSKKINSSSCTDYTHIGQEYAMAENKGGRMLEHFFILDVWKSII